jgi:hypothetical protein
MKAVIYMIAVAVLLPTTVSAQSRYNMTPATSSGTTTVIRDYRTNGVTATVSPNSQGTPVIRDYRTRGVVATIERNSQGETIIRDYRTGRVLSTVGK